MGVFSKRTTWGAILLWAVALGFLYYLLVCHFLPNPSSNLAPLAVYVSALLALAGWMVQTWNTARIGRKQHSMNVLIQTRFSQVHKDHVEKIAANFARGVPFDVATIHADPELRRSVAYLLNYYEFVSVALMQGDLDESIIREAIRGQLVDIVHRGRGFIADARQENANGIPSAEKALVYRRLLPLAERWEKYRLREAKKMRNRRW